MYIVLVHVHVKINQVDEFIFATKENADKSRRNEPGVARFDVIQQADDPTRFVLIEVYRSKDAADEHKKTIHYNQWRDVTEKMMAEPRSRLIFANISPIDSDYS